MTYDLGILVLRLAIGALMFGHGAQKLFGWFGGHGLAGTGAYFASHLRLRPAGFWTIMAALSESGGGLLLALGLLSPLGSLGIIAAMSTAIVLVHWPHFWARDNGIEYQLVLIAGGLAVAIAGPGTYSLDAALGVALPASIALPTGMACVFVGITVALGTRAPVSTDLVDSASVHESPA